MEQLDDRVLLLGAQFLRVVRVITDETFDDVFHGPRASGSPVCSRGSKRNGRDPVSRSSPHPASRVCHALQHIRTITVIDDDAETTRDSGRRGDGHRQHRRPVA
jgi:hypothetical protein